MVSAEEMCKAVVKRAPEQDVLIFAAAVSDWRAERILDHKEKKEGEAESKSLRFVRTPDVALASLETQKPGVIRVGFAAETHDVLQHGLEKLKKKHGNLFLISFISSI